MHNWAIINNVKLVALLATSLLALFACAPVSRTDFPVTEADQEALEEANVSIIRLTPENIRSYSSTKSIWRPSASLPFSSDTWQYHVGVGDVLSITVWDHEELTLPAGSERSQLESGSWVNADGTFFYPYIGQVRANGRSIGEIQRTLTDRLSEYIPDPQIEVKVAAFNSQKVVVTGAVGNVGSQKITNIPLSLIEAINASGGLADRADDRQISIQRNGETYYVNLHSFLTSGRISGNPILQNGDIVNVRLRENSVAFVLGQISQPGAVNLDGDVTVSLTEAITRQGGLLEDTADAKGIFVFRSKGADGGFDVFQLDASTPLAFVIATKFALHPQDVVYIVSDPVTKWNAVITSLLPSVGAVNAVGSLAGGI